MDISVTLLTLAAVALGAVVQGSLGFGMAMVAAPILLLLDPRLVPGPLLCAILCVTVLMTRREWRHIAPSAIAWAGVGGVPGSFIGAWATVAVAADVLGNALGVMIISAVVMSALGHRLRPTPVALIAAGTVSGVMGAVLSMGGPPLALLYQDQPGGVLRGTLAGYFTFASLVALGALVAVGNFGWSEVYLALPLVPAALAGYALSGWVAPRLNKSATRKAVLFLAGAAGVAVLVRY